MTVRFRGDHRRPTAAEINRWNQLADQRARGELRSTPGLPSVKNYDPNARVVAVKNISGSDRSRFDTMSVSDLLWELETDGTADVVFEVDTADPDACPVVLIEPIENGAIGRAIIDGVALAFVGGGSSDYATADATNHRLAPAATGTIKLLIPPHASDVKLLPVVLGVGAPVVSTYLYTLTAAMASGSGTATIRNMADSTEIATGQTVVDTLGHFDGLAIGRRGVCIKAEGVYYAISPYVTDIRWDDPDLEYSRDGGTNWTNIDTAVDCS